MKTKILFISMLPPLASARAAGEHTFCFYFNKFLNDEDFDVRLISCAKYSDCKLVETELKAIDKKIVYWNSPDEKKWLKLINIESKYNLLNRNANLLSNTTEHKILQYIEEYIREGFEPDIIILEWTEMVALATKLKRRYPKIELVASEHDVTFIGYERKAKFFKGIRKLFWKLKYIREKEVEIKALSKCTLVMPHNADNMKELVKAGLEPCKILGLVPYYNNMSEIKRGELNKDILFFGAMNRIENKMSAEWFIKNVMPKLEDLECRFVILGNNPNDELKEYESKKIVLTGFIDDVRPFFAQARCFVAPLLLGAGIKVKVLEAFTSGIPVITNTIGIEGIPARKNEEYYHCETPEEYIKQIRFVFCEEMKASEIGNKGKSFVNKSFSPQEFYQIYKEKIISLLIERREK